MPGLRHTESEVALSGAGIFYKALAVATGLHLLTLASLYLVPDTRPPALPVIGDLEISLDTVSISLSQAAVPEPAPEQPHPAAEAPTPPPPEPAPKPMPKPVPMPKPEVLSADTPVPPDPSPAPEKQAEAIEKTTPPAIVAQPPTPQPQPAQPQPQPQQAAPSVQSSRLTEENRPPRVMRNPTPPYPSDARAAGREGRVRIKVLISEEGRVEQTRLAQSSGFPSLDRAALSALHGWRFVPAYRNGQPTAAWVIVPVNFTLRE